MFGIKDDKNKIIKLDSKEAKVIPVPSMDYRDRPLMHSGHKLYECDMEKGILQEVKYVLKAVNFLNIKTEEFVYLHKKNCRYIPASNEDNALKKLFKLQKHLGQEWVDTTPKKTKANVIA